MMRLQADLQAQTQCLQSAAALTHGKDLLGHPHLNNRMIGGLVQRVAGTNSFSLFASL